MENKYTESKIIVFSTYSAGLRFLSDGASTYDKINAELNKYIGEGWTPVSISSYDSTNGNLAVLFCR